MSGGSYNYLCSKDALDLLGSLSSQEDLARMADRLTELGYDDGVAHDIRLLIGAIDTHRHAVDEVLSRLEPVLHAVEWLDSGDWGEEQVRDAVIQYGRDCSAGG